MKTFILALMILASACSLSGTSPDPTTPPINTESQETDDHSQLLTAALIELVTQDNTFGDGPPPFMAYLIQSSIDPQAGSPTEPLGSGRDLTEAEMAAIEEAISEFGPVTWISDPQEWRIDLQPKIEGSVILGVGEPTIDGDTALVPVSLWCGGLCGTWFTYTAIRTDTGWVIDGIEGPIAIS